MKKAYLVGFSVMTRVVVDSEATEDEIVELAIGKVTNADNIIIDMLRGGVDMLEHDDECPYGTFKGEK